MVEENAQEQQEEIVASVEHEGQEISLNQQDFITLATYADRARMAQSLGQSFGGKRDLYEIFGYKREISYEDYKGMYDRGSFASRIIELPAVDAWQTNPTLTAGDERSDQEPTDGFLAEWNQFIRKHDLYNKFKRLDILSGIGEYAVMLIVPRDHGQDSWSEPLDDSSLSNIEDIAYLKIYSQGRAEVKETVKDATNPRYGLPKLYHIKATESSTPFPVHASRVLHIAENLVESDVYGAPRLKRVYNRLQDLEKVLGGSAEAVWLMVYKGIIFSLDPEATFGEKFTPEQMTDEIEKFIHGFQRYLKLKGVQAEELGGEIVDPTGIVDVLITAIAADTGIPKRILIGSERGELASSQDERNWSNEVDSRRRNHIIPNFLKTFIRWGDVKGIWEKPEDLGFTWKSIFSLTELQKAELAGEVAAAISDITGGFPQDAMDWETFEERYLGDITQ